MGWSFWKVAEILPAFRRVRTRTSHGRRERTMSFAASSLTDPTDARGSGRASTSF